MVRGGVRIKKYIKERGIVRIKLGMLATRGVRIKRKRWEKAEL